MVLVGLPDCRGSRRPGWVVQVNTCWDEMVALVLLLLSERSISAGQAEDWLWSLVEFAEVTYS
jgi:hypothetical protein